jgi:hypothetical protein
MAPKPMGLQREPSAGAYDVLDHDIATPPVNLGEGVITLAIGH